MTEDAVGDGIRGAKDYDPADDHEGCPVTALGHLNGTCYFLTATGEKREYKARDFTLTGLQLLFGGETSWLLPKFEKDTRRPVGEIDVSKATGWLIRRCVAAGLWRADTPERLIGVWREGDDVIAHCGDNLFVYGNKRKRARRRAGYHGGEALYLARSAISPPADVPATARDAAEIANAIASNWNFARLHVPRLVFGMGAFALMGAAPKWRVHAMLTGLGGKAGKTALLRVLVGMMGPQSNFVNDPTEAGLREMLTGEARTIVFDEAGGQGDGDRAQRVGMIIGLLRRMTGEEGARSVRGTGSGARHTVVAGSAILAAANAPVLDAQDRSRILEVELREADPARKALAESAADRAVQLSAALRARALSGFWRFEANLKTYHADLVKIGCDARQADKFGTLFAAAAMMLQDDPVLSAEEDILAYRDELMREVAEDEELSNALRCLNTLLSTQIERWKGGAKSTIGRMVQLARDPTFVEERKQLPMYGLRLETGADGEDELWIANQHRALEKVFAWTDWRDGGHGGALKQLREARAGEVPLNFAGARSRFVIIPRRYLPGPYSEAEDG